MTAVVIVLLLGAAGASGQRRTDFLGVPPVRLDSNALFDGRLLQDVTLNLNSDSWQTLKDRFLEDTYYPADFRWRDQVVRNVGIKSRGTGSRSGTKPGLKVDFKRYVSDQTFLGLTSIVLRNQTQDASNLNERLAMLVFGRMGLPAPREAHARLFVNGEYAGLYTIVEPIDKAFLRRVNGEDAGYLYSYESPVGAPEYYFENRGSDPNLYVPVPFTPETHESNPRADVIEQWVWAINETSSAVFPTAVGAFVDVRRFLQFLAVENFVAEADGLAGNWGMNNNYIYRPADSTTFTFLPWDKSEAFKAGPEYGIFHNVFDVPWRRANRLVLGLLSSPEWRDVYLQALRQCAVAASEPPAGNPAGAGWLERELEFEYSQIREAARRDPVKPFTNEEFEAAVDQLRTFARNRSDYVTSASRDTERR
jgi:hypothetical protein